jgi:hypothetical protein
LTLPMTLGMEGFEEWFERHDGDEHVLDWLHNDLHLTVMCLTCAAGSLAPDDLNPADTTGPPAAVRNDTERAEELRRGLMS